MLRRDDIARLRFEPGPNFTAPSPVFERLPRPPCFLNGRDVLPSLIVARSISTMHRIENADTSFSRGVEDLGHMGNAFVALGDPLYAVPEFSAFGDEVVIWIDQDKPGDLSLICELWHVFLRSISTLSQRMTFDAFCEHRCLLAVVCL